MIDPPSSERASALEPTEPRLLDDRGQPTFRAVFGRLCAGATGLDIALTHLRLTTLDLTEGELAGVRRIRLLLAEVSAASLDAEAYTMFQRAPTAAGLRRLLCLVNRGTIEIRSAPLRGWSPDFSIFLDGDAPFATLIGPHRFDRGAVHEGPLFASLHGAGGAGAAAARFSEIWTHGHDIRPAIAGILARAERQAPTPNPTTISRLARSGHSVDTHPARG